MRHAISACRFFYKMQSSRLQNLFLGGGRSQLFREKCLNFVCRCLQKGPAHDHRSRQKSSEMPNFCLPHPPKRPHATLEVDKNRAKSPKFVYCPVPRNRTDSSAVILGSAAKISLHEAHLHSALSKCSSASPLHPKALDFTKKEPPKIGRFLRCAAFIFFSVIRS